MDRSSRRMSARRPLYGSSTSSPPPSFGETSFGRHSPVSPVLKSHSWHTTAQPASHTHQGRRVSRANSHHDLSFSTPEENRDPALRRRSRAADGFAESPAPMAGTPNDAGADDGPMKGGHSLRRRTRVNYATEQIDDEVTVPNSSSSARLRKRRPDSRNGNDDSSEDLYGLRLKGRGTSLGADSPSGRRRNPSRKSAESRAYREELDNEGYGSQGGMQDEIRDTIQVGNWSSAASSPSSKSDSNDSASHKPASPGHGSAAQSPPHASQDQNYPSETNEPNHSANSTAEPPVVGLAKGDGQDVAIDPSLQYHVGPVQSRQGSEKATGFTPSSAIDHRSNVPGSKSPPVTPRQRPYEPAATHSPEPIQNGTPMDLDSSKPATTPNADEPQSSAQLPVEPSAEPAGESNNASMDSSTQQQDATKSSLKLSTDEVAPETLPSSNDKEDQLISIKKDTTMAVTSPTKVAENTTAEKESIATALPGSQNLTVESAPNSPLKEEPVPEKPAAAPDSRWCRAQPTPVGRWSHLTPYVNGEYSVYPEKKARPEDDDASEDQSPEDKDSNKESNDVDPAADDNEDTPEGVTTELPTPALNTPTRGSPVPDTIELTAPNSPVAAAEEPEDPDVSEPPEPIERKKHYRYRKLRDPEEFITAVENYEEMSTSELYDVLQAINLSLVGWQEEWTTLGKIVDDCENSSRRRIADAKYETRTRNLHQHGTNYEEPEFAVRGYKAKEKETMSETRYLQAQDRIMAAAYGFEYDPHPSKIGRQNPDTQQAGVTTRGRSLRNQPRQTAKATEADGVTGKRQRKPVQLFDPATQDASRASTPVPTRRGRRKNADMEDAQASFTSSFNGEPNSDDEAAPGSGRRRRGARRSLAGPRIVEDFAAANGQKDAMVQEGPPKPARRGRPPRTAPREQYFQLSQPVMDQDPRTEAQPRKLLTLKIPKGKTFSEPSSTITDNGDSRPSSSSSDSTTQTAESSYSFRPKRQKRFRDEPADSEGAAQGPPKKRSRRVGPAENGDEVMTAGGGLAPEAAQNNGSNRKGPKIKLMRPSNALASDSRNGTPMSQPTTEGGEEQPKEYRAMTKSEKMSASMKSRWANGNMAGAVEKRKATLAAKKAAQAAAEQRMGPIAPKPKAKAGKKVEAPLPGENPTFVHTQHPPPPPPPPHHPHHHHIHPHPQPHPHQFAPHQHPHQHPHPPRPHPQPEYPGMGAPFPTS